MVTVKAVPIEAFRDSEGSRKLRLSEFIDMNAESLSALGKARLTLQKIFLALNFLLEIESTPGPKCGRKN